MKPTDVKPALTMGQQIARAAFKKRGNQSEMHLTEKELVAFIDAGIEMHMYEHGVKSRERI